MRHKVYLLVAIGAAALGAVVLWRMRAAPVGEVTVKEMPNVAELQILTPILGVLETMGLPVQPRGIRNNNPGNIRYNAAVQWKGQKGSDGAFCIFESAELGIRALNRVLNSYASRGVDTVREVITTWAPPVENNTASYIASVAAECGVGADQVPQRLKLVKAIIQHENGKQPYTDQQIINGMYAV